MSAYVVLRDTGTMQICEELFECFTQLKSRGADFEDN